MSAQEIIYQIEHLPPTERAQVTRTLVEHAAESPRRFTVAVSDDGLPVIRANGGLITSRLVHDLESLTP